MLFEKSLQVHYLPPPPGDAFPATAANTGSPLPVPTTQHFASAPVPVPAGAQPTFRGGDETIEDARYVIRKSKSPLRCETALLEWLRTNTTIPVPMPLCQGYDEKIRRFYQVFEKPAGTPLCDRWDDMSILQQDQVILEVQGYIRQIRSILPSQVPNQAARDRFLDPKDGAVRGPYFSTDDFLSAIAERIDRIGSLYDAGPTKKAIRFLKALRALPTDHNMVFTHGNICPKNILVDEDGKVVSILDWSEAGYAPAFWEYVKSYLDDDDSCFYLDEAPDRMMDPWPLQLSVMMHAHDIIW
jgi:aminoglycoside phosphotransferase (APT) family kinase protein